MMDVAGEMSGSLVIVAFFYFGIQNDELIRDIFGWTLLPGLLAVVIVMFFVADSPKKHQSGIDVVNRDDYKLFWLLGNYFLFLMFFMSEQYFIVESKASGMTLMQIPFLVIVSTLTQTLLSYYSGVFTDRFGVFFMLFLSYMLGIVSTLFLWQHYFWLSFAFLGAFSVVSLNALRTYISLHAKSQKFIYGVFYKNIAFFNALGAVLIGRIWSVYSFEASIYFSVAGSLLMMMGLFFIKARSEI